MKNFIAEMLAALIIGSVVGILMNVLGIEVTIWQVMMLLVGTVVTIGIVTAIKNLITKGGLYSYEWMIQYNEHSISVKANIAEELYINGSLADRKTGISRKAVELKGLLDSGEKITAVISPAKFKEASKSGRALRCELFVDGKALQMATA